MPPTIRMINETECWMGELMEAHERFCSAFGLGPEDWENFAP